MVLVPASGMTSLKRQLESQHQRQLSFKFDGNTLNLGRFVAGWLLGLTKGGNGTRGNIPKIEDLLRNLNGNAPFCTPIQIIVYYPS